MPAGEPYAAPAAVAPRPATTPGRPASCHKAPAPRGI